MKGIIRKLLSVIMVLGLSLGLAGCSSSSELTGNWVLSSNAAVVMEFKGDGSVDDIFYSDADSGDPTGYSVGSDKALTLKFSDGKTVTFENTTDEEEALKDRNLYYLDGNTLVFQRRIYTREGADMEAVADLGDETTDAADTEQEIDIDSLPGSVEGGQKYLATISVENMGDIVVELDEGIAPQTVQNFVKLANEGFYDGLTFHRIMDGFMIQGGDPLGNGTGGSDETIYGEFLENGFNNTLSHTRGVISMARSSDPNSASSQFFIVHEDSTFLDGSYAAFGRVVEGMDIVDEIATSAEPTDNNGTIPREDQPVITSITVVEE